MPYGYRRYSTFRRTFRSRRPTTSTFRRRYGARRRPVARLSRVVNELRQQAEVRIKDVYVTPTALDQDGFRLLLNGMLQGSGEGDRLGTKIIIKSIEFRVSFEAATTSDEYNKLRFMLVQDRQPNNAVYTTGQLLQSTTDTVHSLKNYFFRNRFKIHMDRTIVVDQDDPTKFRKYYKRLWIPVTYSDNNNNIASISTNALYLQFYSDSFAAPHPDIQLYVRIRYTA